MDKMKQWVALTAVGVLVILAAGWFLLVSPKRSDAADLRTQAAAQESTNNGLDAKLASLKALQKQMPQYQAQLAQVAAKIPDNPALPALIRALTTAADNAGVELVTVAPGVPALFQAAAPAQQKVAPAAGAAPAPAAAPLEVISLSMNVVGGYFETERFFDQIENLSRALKVTGFTLAPGSNPVKPAAAGAGAPAPADDGRVLASSVTASVFMSLPSAPAPAVVAPVK